MPTYGPWIELPPQEVLGSPASAFWRTSLRGPDGEVADPYDEDGDGWKQGFDPEFEPNEFVAYENERREDSGDPIPLDGAHIANYVTWVGSEAAATGGNVIRNASAPVFSTAHANTEGLPTEFDPTRYFDSEKVNKGFNGELFYLMESSLDWDGDWLAAVPGGWPEDATGFELEEPRGQVVAASVTVKGETRLLGGSMGPLELVVAVTQRWLTEGRQELAYAFEGKSAAGGLEEITAPVPYTVGLDEYAFEEVDLTTTVTGIEYASDPVGPGLIAPISLWYSIRKPIDAPEFGLHLEDGYVSGSASASYVSANVPNPVVYMVKPPRIRWVYEATPVTPPPPPVSYRRTYPRDDGLANGSPRTFPAPRSVQGSNRTFGGYL
jgi:hypothetical protein